MKDANESKRAWVVNGVAYLFIVLFIYAAVSKILDFETFRVQLAQSPLLSAYAGIIAWLVPGVEIMIALFLILPRFRNLALYASFFLMVMFTTYIYIILNFSDFVPCSCGGVLEKMSWTQHLIFNVGFIVLGTFAILLSNKKTIKQTLLVVLIITLVGIGIIMILFSLSEKKMDRNNAFIRRYPHHPVNISDTLYLKYNSYYFAGFTKDHIYLGNYTAPLNVLRISNNLKDSLTFRIKLMESSLIYKSPKLKILDSTFFLVDGQVPIIHRGSIENWVISDTYTDISFFTILEPIDNDVLAFRTVSSETGMNVIGSINLNLKNGVSLFPNILEGNIDGYFDRDGALLFNRTSKKLIYVYYYKNEYLEIKNNFLDINIRNTIDTISKPILDIHEIKDLKQHSLGGKSILVNGISTTSDKLLLINSKRFGRYEPEHNLKRMSIIDVYNINESSYKFSFYLYRSNEQNLLDLKLYGNNLFAIMDNYLYKYKIKEENLK